MACPAPQLQLRPLPSEEDAEADEGAQLAEAMQEEKRRKPEKKNTMTTCCYNCIPP